MDNKVAIIITGIYTIVYLVVFIVQRSELKKTKSINKSMTSFMNLFDLTKLKEYNSIIEKTADLKISMIKKEESDKLSKVSKVIIDSSFDATDKYFTPRMNEMKVHILIYIMLYSNTHDGRKEYIEKNLPINKEAFICLLDSLENKKTP
jgi:uncharacterized membrane protein